MLMLNDNEITGRLPATLGRLTHLETLTLQNNRLTGVVPVSFPIAVSRLELQDNDSLGGTALPCPAGVGNIFSSKETVWKADCTVKCDCCVTNC